MSPGCGLAWSWPRVLALGLWGWSGAWVTEGAPHLCPPPGAPKGQEESSSGDLTALQLSRGPDPEAALWPRNQWYWLWEGWEPCQKFLLMMTTCVHPLVLSSRLLPPSS